MRYIEAPFYYELLPNQPKVFLAGGITSCPDWQSEFVEKVKDIDITIFNPRRKSFDMKSNNAVDQIRWEAKHLKESNIIVFWFCKETVQPIVLLEYGKYALGFNPQTTILVGIEPGYTRELDVITQSKIVNPLFKWVNSLDALASELRYTVTGRKND